MACCVYGDHGPQVADDYGGVAQVLSQCGIPALAKTLNAILVDHIRALLPSLRVHLEESRDRRAKELAVLGEAPPGHTSAAR